MEDLTLDKLMKVMKDFEDNQPQLNFPEIDDMISKGNKIEDLVMIHSFPELRDRAKVKTKHGYIDLLYTSPLNVTIGTGYVMRKQPNSVAGMMKLIRTVVNVKEE